jgi:simple sugar transport system ATP-binding protein
MHQLATAGGGEKPLLALRDINMTFGGVRALKNVSFDVRPGEVHCLAGENGCGKSTLIKIITGVYRPADGASIEFDGETYSHMSPVTAQDRGIQVIWQDLALFPEMSVAENIAFQMVLGRWPKLVDYGRMRQIATDALARLGVTLDVDLPLKEYAIAQRQIVAIARALVGEARLVFMDEPTGGLDVSVQARLLDLVRGLVHDLGLAAIIVTHDLAVARLLSHRMMVMKDGAVIEQGLTDRVLDDPREPYTQLLVSSILQV